MAKIILIALLVLLFTMIHGLPPCSDYYTSIIRSISVRVGESDHIRSYDQRIGQIKIASSPESSEYSLKVVFNINPSVHKDEPIAQLKMVQSISEIANTIQQGKPLLYNVHFPKGQKNIPILTKIWFNDQQICANSKREKNIPITTKVLRLVVNFGGVSLGFKCSLCSLSQTFTQENDNDKNGITIINNNDNNIINNNNDNNNNECGISNTDYKNLSISNGVETMLGHWPWHVIIFGVKFEFKCAGSILTTKHIITAAHCLKVSSSSNDTFHPNMVVGFGRFNFLKWRESETLNRVVLDYRIHPDYMHGNTADFDLAILILRTPVEYNPFIKPICLWSGSTDLRNIVNTIGYVATWEEDTFYSSVPRIVKAPIVSQETCLQSHPSFHLSVSSRAFCAGLRNQNDPCIGDGGSGLVIYDAIMGRYQLRGLISRMLPGNDTFCDFKNYIVYVDVAKYVPWIKEQISTTNSDLSLQCTKSVDKLYM